MCISVTSSQALSSPLANLLDILHRVIKENTFFFYCYAPGVKILFFNLVPHGANPSHLSCSKGGLSTVQNWGAKIKMRNRSTFYLLIQHKLFQLPSLKILNNPTIAFIVICFAQSIKVYAFLPQLYKRWNKYSTFSGYIFWSFIFKTVYWFDREGGWVSSRDYSRWVVRKTVT